jgi:predicted RNA-binding protein YlxR (DUF448 family)
MRIRAAGGDLRVGTGTGRGAWCCRSLACVRALSARTLSRALRVDVDDVAAREIVATLGQSLGEGVRD